MNKLLTWLLGIGLGAATGAVLVAILVPQSSKEIRERLKAGYDEAFEQARLASRLKRAELESELSMLHHQPTLPPPDASLTTR